MTNADLLAHFNRPTTRHRFTARTVTVAAVTQVENFIRVSLASPELHDWASTGPSDHARVFFPDPDTGVLNAPAPAGHDTDGIVRPDLPMHGRDFTPMNMRELPETGERAFDLDILQHANAGPASRWAAGARPGDQLVVVGPRGSREVATDAPRVLCFVDGTALPAAARWVSEMPASADVRVIVDADEAAAETHDAGANTHVDADSVAGSVTDAAESARRYLRAQCGRDVPVTAATDGFVAAATAAGIDADTYVFVAGEATSLIPLRRLLRHELGLPREQYAVTGYWRRGDTAFDHHAPIDPTDPDE
ncbi:siderophore-interacting protein [Leucobacter salsicius]|uniref:siderophore-interacting protein n=1 Tax=Leucobacter salsicius TaxID=664638 RepID=UPI00034AFED4|nr:siderophore-interacting protein [Leucobacter salsicius]